MADNNPNVIFRKKAYEPGTDSTVGVITFDSESKKIYLGGESYGNVQADWNQSIGTAPDFIKNKPFGEPYCEDVDIELGYLGSESGDYQVGVYEWPSDFEFSDIERITIGTFENTVSEIREWNEAGVYYIGNLSLVSQGATDTGEDYFVAQMPYQSVGTALGVVATYLNPEDTVHIGYTQCGVTKIGSEFVELAFDDLTDAIIREPNDGDFVLYIGSDEQWENVTPEIIEIQEDEDSGDENYYSDALTDGDGNKYGAVIIGSQVWMAENLKTTSYSDGTSIPEGDYADSTPYRTYPGYNNTTDVIESYGRLYNGAAMISGVSPDSTGSGTRGAVTPHLMPAGWKIPTVEEIETLYNAMKYSAPKSDGDTKASSGGSSSSSNTNELFPFFRPQYAGGVIGLSGGSAAKGDTKIATSRNNDFDFGDVMYLWSRTEAGGGQSEERGASSTNHFQVFTVADRSGGGDVVIKGSVGSTDASGYMSVMNVNDTDFYSVRGLYDGTSDEFLTEYYQTHASPSIGTPTAEGKFLKNLGGNQLAWSDISWNDLKERPFGDTCFESTVSVTIGTSDNVGHENTNPSGGVLYSYVDLSNLDNNNNPPIKAIIGGTIEVDLDFNTTSEYGNYEYLGGLYWDNSPWDSDTGDGWGVDFNGGEVYTLTSVFGNTPPTVELVFNDCVTKQLNNKYLNLSDVAFSGNYYDLINTPKTQGANIVEASVFNGGILSGYCDKLHEIIFANSYLFVNFANSCNYQSLRQFQVYSDGQTVGPRAPIWINGSEASSTNYTIPAGMYVVYYDGTKYMIRTDGKLPDGMASTDLAGLNDVSIGTMTDGQVLMYSSSEDKWVNGEASSIIVKDWAII